jgi:hypothetical protein
MFRILRKLRRKNGKTTGVTQNTASFRKKDLNVGFQGYCHFCGKLWKIASQVL